MKSKFKNNLDMKPYASMMLSGPYIFISYPHELIEYAHKIVEILLSLNFRVCIDEYDGNEYNGSFCVLPSGSNIREELNMMIQSCHVFLCLLSKEYSESSFCQNELACADEIGIPIFPIIIAEKDKYSDLPASLKFYFRTIKVSKLPSEINSSFESKFMRLVNASMRFLKLNECKENGFDCFDIANYCFDNQDYESALKWYDKAINTYACANAMCKLGKIYESGINSRTYHLSQDINKAYSLYQMGHNYHNSSCTCNLGYFHENPNYGMVDYEKALKYYEIAAYEYHHARAYYGLARLYYYGLGVKADHEQAIRHFQKYKNLSL